MSELGSVERVRELAAKISADPCSYEAICAAASIYEDVKKVVAKVMFARYKEVVWTRNRVVVTPEFEPASGHGWVGVRVKVPGEYRDYITASLDGVVMWSTSCSKGPLISELGIYG